MFKAPGGLEVIRVIGGLAFIELYDPLDRILLAIRLDKHGMRREVEPAGREHHVVAHFTRGLQIFIEQCRRHR